LDVGLLQGRDDIFYTNESLNFSFRQDQHSRITSRKAACLRVRTGSQRAPRKAAPKKFAVLGSKL
jgi:hypothetical protein